MFPPEASIDPLLWMWKPRPREINQDIQLQGLGGGTGAPATPAPLGDRQDWGLARASRCWFPWLSANAYDLGRPLCQSRPCSSPRPWVPPYPTAQAQSGGPGVEARGWEGAHALLATRSQVLEQHPGATSVPKPGCPHLGPPGALSQGLRALPWVRKLCPRGCRTDHPKVPSCYLGWHTGPQDRPLPSHPGVSPPRERAGRKAKGSGLAELANPGAQPSPMEKPSPAPHPPGSSFLGACLSSTLNDTSQGCLGCKWQKPNSPGFGPKEHLLAPSCKAGGEAGLRLSLCSGAGLCEALGPCPSGGSSAHRTLHRVRPQLASSSPPLTRDAFHLSPGAGIRVAKPGSHEQRVGGDFPKGKMENLSPDD